MEKNEKKEKKTFCEGIKCLNDYVYNSVFLKMLQNPKP